MISLIFGKAWIVVLFDDLLVALFVLGEPMLALRVLGGRHLTRPRPVAMPARLCSSDR